jgi:DNA invertase Pin-like site-specific DNA recombinase
MQSLSSKNKLVNPVSLEFNPKAVVGYKRVSFLEDDKKTGDRKDSLEVQDKLIRTYAERKGLPVRHMYCDPGVSGYDDANRPKFLAMKNEIEEGDIICVYDFSRVARKIKHLLVFLD